MIMFSPKRASYTKGKLSLQFIVATILSWVRDFITAPECPDHGLRTPSEEIAFTARPKIQSQIQIFRYGRTIFCLPHRPNFSDIFDLCLHWVSVVRGLDPSDDYKVYRSFTKNKTQTHTLK